MHVLTVRHSRFPRRARSGLFAIAVLTAVIVGACGGGGGDREDWVVLDVYQENETWFVEYKPPGRHLARTAVNTGPEPGACAQSAIPGDVVPGCVHEIRELNEAGD